MKRFLCMFLAIIMCLSVPMVAFAEISETSDESYVENDGTGRVDPTRPEETVWYYRIYNGRYQMRLWSITYRKWLTDWIDIGPA